MLTNEEASKVFELSATRGFAVLILNPDRVPFPANIALEEASKFSRENVLHLVERIAAGMGGIYTDPDRILDAAIIDKMIVI